MGCFGIDDEWHECDECLAYDGCEKEEKVT